MTKKLFFCLALAGLFLTNGYSQNAAGIPDLLMTVANLRNDSLSGTSVFIQNKESDYYLVATAHIARTMDRNVLVVMQGADQLLQFKITEFANPVVWVYHPTMDLAVLKLNPKALFFNKYLLNRFIPLASVDSTRRPLPQDSLLTIMGFQPGSRSPGFFPPLAYTSIPTSEKIILDDPEKALPSNVVILEKPSVSGYNGGPVFLLEETDPSQDAPAASTPLRMVGFIQGKIKDNAERSFLMMIPSVYLWDLLK